MRKKIRVILSYTFATTLVFAMITGCGSKSKNAENKTAKIVELSDKETTNKDEESAKDEKTAKTEADSKTEAASKEETTSETEMTAKTEGTTIIQPTEQEQTESFDVEPMNNLTLMQGHNQAHNQVQNQRHHRHHNRLARDMLLIMLLKVRHCRQKKLNMG